MITRPRGLVPVAVLLFVGTLASAQQGDVRRVHDLEQSGRHWLVHHYYDARQNGVPTLQIRPLSWDDEGWPVAGEPLSAPPAPAASRPATLPGVLAPGDHLRRVEVDGRDRAYLVHVPPGFDARRPTPVVLIFHGAMMNALAMVQFCGMNEKSDQAGFVAVYPNGTGVGDALLTFNAWAAPAKGARPDDVAFTARLLDDLGTAMSIDPRRVFATGLSNGGFMSYRLAAELSDRIAAIAPVAGTLALAECRPKRAVPVLHFHGTADRIVPYEGFVSRRGMRVVPIKSVEETMRIWIELNGCPAEPAITDLPDAARDGTTVQKRVYGPGRDGAEVVLVVIRNGGHTWPGRVPPVPFIGLSTRDISANDLIWDFFSRHPMP